jgi:serine/threonine-protein kinase
MAPEQAEGQARAVGPAADVYALGVILYELLTGRPPFLAETPLDTLMQVRLLDPVPPRRLQPKVPRDLQTVCLKCLEKDPRRRYASAEALAEDLGRFQAGEPIRARPAGWLERLTRWGRRHPAAAALWAVSLAVLLAGAGGGLWRARDQAERRAVTARAVGQALDRALALCEQERWGAALAEARRAEALLERAPAGEGLGRRVRELLADLALIEALEDIRLRMSADKDGRLDLPRTDREYAAAFRGYGIDLQALAPEEAAARIRARSIKDKVAAALDFWSHVRRRTGQGGDAGWQRLVQVARRVDPDPWRNRLRGALARRDGPALKALAAEAEAASLPAPTLLLLSDALDAAGARAEGVRVLRRGQLRHPGDFWINYQLAFNLARMNPPQSDDALGFLRAALALRSHSAALHARLGAALVKKGLPEEAIAACREALRLDKDCAEAHYHLRIALERKGQ